MRLVQQPKDSKLCGQACVAMVLVITLEEACASMGRKKTSTADIVDALGAGGVKVAKQRKRSRGGPLPKRAILAGRSQVDGKSIHWLLQWDGKIYDPAAHYAPHSYAITSYIVIEGQ